MAEEELSWRLMQGIKDRATGDGEAIAEAHNFSQPPVNPFEIIKRERLIIPFGANFGDAFDGRLEYQAPSFLLFYNTRFNRWAHDGEHHPKVLFTAAHELGHFFTDEHRDYLRRGGSAHRSFAEFASDSIVEQQADSFATGLLMPSYLLRPTVNQADDVSLDVVKTVRARYQVPLVSMLVRWTQLNDFPSATLCVVPNGTIKWGYISEGFSRVGIFRVLRGKRSSQSAQKFLSLEPSLSKYREGAANGYAHLWLDTPIRRLSVREHYIVIPYRRELFVLLVADEEEVEQATGVHQFDD
jgi:hypothetical protein